MISPVPRVVVTLGSRLRGGTRASPDAWAISMTAVCSSPIAPQEASSGWPRGPVTILRNIWPPLPSTSASTVPSPPSATGANTVSERRGQARLDSALNRPGRRQSRDVSLEPLWGNHVIFNAITPPLYSGPKLGSRAASPRPEIPGPDGRKEPRLLTIAAPCASRMPDP